MKPVDLKPPFTWKERQVAAGDRMFFVPPGMDESAYQAAMMPSFESWFPGYSAVHLEFCSGNGDWIVEKARQDPTSLWIALEMRFDRCRKIWSKRENLALPNLAIICGRAELVSKYYLKDRCLDSVYVNFPDPWPKNRHAKYRLVTPHFVEELARMLKPSGLFMLATDDALYCKRAISCFQACSAFAPQFPSPHFVTELPDYGRSYFETLWRDKGRTLHFVNYSKID